MERLEEFLKECYNNLLTKPQTPRGAAIDVDALDKSWKSVEECDKEKLSAIYDALCVDFTKYIIKSKSEYKKLFNYCLLRLKYNKILSDLFGFKYHYEPDPDGEKIDKGLKEALIHDNATEELIVDNLFIYYIAAYYKIPQKEAPDGSFFNLPTSSELTLYEDVLATGKDIAKLPDRKMTYNHKAADEFKITQIGSKVAIVQAQNKAIVVINNAEDLAHKAHQTKLFTHILKLANEQCYRDGTMSRYYIEFPLDDLIGDNLYMNDDTARIGFAQAMFALQLPAIAGAAVKQTDEGEGLEPKGLRIVNLFIDSYIENRMCVVWLNDHIIWEYLFQYFTIIPNYYMQLTDRASALLIYIFTQARQNGKKIKNGKSFTMSFRSICCKLNIPTEKEIKDNPTRYQRKYTKNIIQPLTDAIGKLIAVKDPGYTITVHSKEGSPISEYLDTGYLEITIKKDSPYYERLTEMTDRQDRIIQGKIEKKERKEAKVAAIKKARSEKKAAGKTEEQA